MRGLVCKDILLFFKSIDKRLIVIAVFAVILVFVNTERYSSLLATLMLSLTVSMQNVLNYNSDEKSKWVKYQRATPLSDTKIVISRYIANAATLVVTILGAIIFTMISTVIFGSFYSDIFSTSLLVSLIIPLLWASIHFPIVYYFGFQATQIIRFILIIPIVFIFRLFEDKVEQADLLFISENISTFVFFICIATLIIYIVSCAISIVVYKNKVR